MQTITLFLNGVVRSIVSNKGLISETPIIFIREIYSEAYGLRTFIYFLISCEKYT